ncbi:PSP1 domain-containing protein [Aggregatilinea lenta]|uniref:PSP1 domain-containing protein n=1 Tax=Aggregatilinea lenta TaxID=913108 RepID=UPI000E5BE1F9|nr:regulatory iron-sulfur-containing complex subunit RicT [Aggregatilinea lenta]
MTLINDEQTQTVSGSIAGVRFNEVGKLYHFSCTHLPDLQVGEHVIVETARGMQMGQVMNLLPIDGEETLRDYKPILRKSTSMDQMSAQLWKSREVEALIICREKASEIGGYETAKFVAAQYNFDGTLLAFLFSADDKLNTNRLRSALQRSFKAKVEMRQVGPRDVAKLIGGMGACGIPRCCSTFLTDFSPISIKMAKAQGISLNPSEITGMCGRLRCCLIYEYEQYVEARKQLPKRNKRIGTPHGEGRVIDVHPLRDAVTVIVEDTRHVVTREEIIPLEEWEALKAKAEQPCAKHEGGECDCGANRGRASLPPTATEEEPAVEPDEEVDMTDVIDLDNLSGRSQADSNAPDRKGDRGGGRRRSRGRRGRGRQGSGKPLESGDQTPPQSE